MDRASLIDSTQATVAVVDAPRLAGCHADPDGTALTSIGRLGNPAQREQALAYTRACLDLAHRLGAYGVTMQSGVEPPPGQWLEVARTVAPDLKALGDAASDLGLELTLELHKSMPMATGQQAADLMALACALRETGYRRAAVIELEYEDAAASEVRPDLRRAEELLTGDFVVA